MPAWNRPFSTPTWKIANKESPLRTVHDAFARRAGVLEDLARALLDAGQGPIIATGLVVEKQQLLNPGRLGHFNAFAPGGMAKALGPGP